MYDHCASRHGACPDDACPERLCHAVLSSALAMGDLSSSLHLAGNASASSDPLAAPFAAATHSQQRLRGPMGEPHGAVEIGDVYFPEKARRKKLGSSLSYDEQRHASAGASPAPPAVFNITAFVNWLPRDGRAAGGSLASSSSMKLLGNSSRSDLWGSCVRLIPFKRITSLFRAIVTMILILLATQQILFLWTEDAEFLNRLGSIDLRRHPGRFQEGSAADWGAQSGVQGDEGMGGSAMALEGVPWSLPEDTRLLAALAAGRPGAQAGGTADSAAAEAREWVREIRLCIMTARSLVQMAEDSGDQNLLTSARQEMEECMSLMDAPSAGAKGQAKDTLAMAALKSAAGTAEEEEESEDENAEKDSDLPAGKDASSDNGSNQSSASVVSGLPGLAAGNLAGDAETLGRSGANMVSGINQVISQDKAKESGKSQEDGGLTRLFGADASSGSQQQSAAVLHAHPSPLKSFQAAVAALLPQSSGRAQFADKKAKDSPGMIRLKRKLEASEQQTKAALLQSMLYSQLAAKSVPRGLHCLALRLTLAWNSSPSLQPHRQGLDQPAGATNASSDKSQAMTSGAEQQTIHDGVPQADGWSARLTDPSLHHYALFSDNVLAVAVVVNSTATHVIDPTKHVFHIVTDRMNLAAIRAWLALNSPAGGQLAYEVVCLDDFPWVNSSFVPVLRQAEMKAMREYYYRPINAHTAAARAAGSNAASKKDADGASSWQKTSTTTEAESSSASGRLFGAAEGAASTSTGPAGGISSSSSSSISSSGSSVSSRGAFGSGADEFLELKYRNPKYLSILNHLRFYLPLIFPNLTKILFLDDDVVVQRDLSALWDVPMHGNVNLAVETCGKTFHRFKTYLNFSSPLLSSFDPEGCAWAFGMNLFDLAAWRKGNFIQKYHFWQQQNENRTLWKLGSLPAGLLTFYNATEILPDRTWHVLGLGSKRVVSLDSVRRAGVVHWNGHAKPWMDLANPLYQHVWTQYVPYDNEFVRQCNIEPPRIPHKPPPGHTRLQLMRLLQLTPEQAEPA